MNEWKLYGTVSRKPYTTAKFGRLSLKVENGRRTSYFDVKAFDAVVIDEMAELSEGDEVAVKGELMSEEFYLDKQPVKDGRGKSVWVIGLKATAVRPAQANAPRPARQPDSPPPDDSDIPF